MQTNLIVKVTQWSNDSKPWFSTELTVDDSFKAQDIADKLNDVAGAKGEERVSYHVTPFTYPSLHEEKKVDDDDIPF